MRLSIAFPVDLAELEGFVLAARHLGATAVEVEAGRTTGDAELVVMVPAVAPTTGAASGPTSLTAKGWAAIGRTAPTTRPAPPAPVAEARPAPPKPIDLGPIERRPFDPDRVRQSQAEAS